MTTRKSSFKLARVLPFVRNVLHRNCGLFGFYSALSLLFLPVPFALSLYRAKIRAAAYAQYDMTWYDVLQNNMGGMSDIYNAFSAVFYTALILIMPILVSAVLYSYMHNRRSTDVYHALPLTREELFLGTAIAAGVIMLLPLAVNYIIMGIFAAAIPSYSVLAVFLDFLVCAAIMLAIFAVTSFCATQVGTVQDQIMFTLLVNCSLSGGVLILYTLADSFLYGFRVGSDFFKFAAELCPFSLLVMRLFYDDITNTSYYDGNFASAVWFIAAIVLLLVSARLYAHRKSEQAEVVGNLGFLQCYARTVGTLIGGVCLAWVITAALDMGGQAVPMLLATAVGGLIIYYIGDFILARRVRGARATYKAAFATVAVVCLLCAGVIFDFTGYETRVPDADDVVSVTIDDFSSRYGDQYNGSYNDTVVLTDGDDIAAVLAAHKSQSAMRSTSYSGENRALSLTYKLKSGRTMSRAYASLCTEAADALTQLETSDEVIRQTAAIYNMGNSEISSVTVIRASDSLQGEVDIKAINTDALVTALQVDLLNQTAEELESGARGIAYIDITVKMKKSNYDGSVPIQTVAEIEGSTSDYYYYYNYRYLLTESFTKTLGVLRAAGMSEYLADKSDNLTAVGLALYGSYTWSRSAYIVADGNEPSFNAGIDSQVNSPVVLLTTAEYESLRLHRMSYYPNRQNDYGDLAAILFYTDTTAQGGKYYGESGGYYTRLSELPDSLRERVISAWCTYNGIDRSDFEANYYPVDDMVYAEPASEEVYR